MSALNEAYDSIKVFTRDAKIGKYLSGVYEIGASPAIMQLSSPPLVKNRHTRRFDEYFHPDACGFFICAKCSGQFHLNSGVYIIADKIARYLERLNFLSPRVLFRYVFLHELAHLILHGILPKRIRTEYMRAKSEIEFNRNLEEAYCELCAILALKNGAWKFLTRM